MKNIVTGEKLRDVRIAAGFTQQQLADKLSIAQQNISQWEKGQYPISKHQQKEIRKIFGLDTKETTESPSAFGVWLASERAKKNETVAELADKAKVSIMTIYNIETGRVQNPTKDIQKKLTGALEIKVPKEVADATSNETKIVGLGSLENFDPLDLKSFPSVAGVYVLYDIAQRPVYVGEGENIGRRLKSHETRFWYKAPIVSSAAYVIIEDRKLRRQIEELLIAFLKSNALLNKKGVRRSDEREEEDEY